MRKFVERQAMLFRIFNGQTKLGPFDMVDPKKDYELLMRYLQGGAAKHEPVAIPEPSYGDDWQPVASTPNVSLPKRTSQTARKQRRPPTFNWQALSIRRRLRLAIAALSIFILVVATWKAYAFFSLTPEHIFNQVYTPIALPTAQSATPNIIESYYTTGNYVAATLQAKKQAQLSDREQLLTGLAYMQRDDYGRAIKWLEPLANNFKSSYRQYADYYLALNYLKNEDYDHCIERMEQIRFTPAHPFHDQISAATIRDVRMLKWK